MQDVIVYLAEESPAAALRLAEAFDRSLARLRSLPRLGRIPSDERLSRLGYRFLVVEDYLIFYVLSPEGAVVHRIIHGARDLRGLL